MVNVEQVLQGLVKQVELDQDRPYWKGRWRTGAGDEIGYWLNSLVDHGWPERFETSLTQPTRILVTTVQQIVPKPTRPRLVGVYAALPKAMQECAQLHYAITGRAMVVWVNDIDEDTGVQHGWIGTDPARPEWRYEVLNLAQYEGTP